MHDTGPEGTVQRTYRLTGYSGEERDARLEIRAFDRAARLRRAVGGLAAWWTVAIACAFIPVAHFALVPGFLLFGLFTFVQRLRTATVVVAARGSCPDCDAEQDLDLLGPWREGRDLACRACHRSLRLTAMP